MIYGVLLHGLLLCCVVFAREGMNMCVWFVCDLACDVVWFVTCCVVVFMFCCCVEGACLLCVWIIVR